MVAGREWILFTRFAFPGQLTSSFDSYVMRPDGPDLRPVTSTPTSPKRRRMATLTTTLAASSSFFSEDCPLRAFQTARDQHPAKRSVLLAVDQELGECGFA